jgi:acyl-coenzyme A synthetase/AMP-(fatty) acid ligase
MRGVIMKTLLIPNEGFDSPIGPVEDTSSSTKRNIATCEYPRELDLASELPRIRSDSIKRKLPREQGTEKK